MVYKSLEFFRKCVLVSLSVLMAVTISFSIVDLAWILISDLLTPPTFLLHISVLLDIFGLFLLVLIGLELMDTIAIYIKDHIFHVETVMMVAIIAVARKVITLEIKELPFQTTLSIAALILALSGGYYIFRGAHK